MHFIYENIFICTLICDIIHAFYGTDKFNIIFQLHLVANKLLMDIVLVFSWEINTTAMKGHKSLLL